MDIAREFDDYMAYLMQGLGHADRHAGLSDYCTGLMLPLSLTWDHRVIDGAAAARFNAHLGNILADFRRVLL